MRNLHAHLVASRADAWIETKVSVITGIWPPVASRADAWIETSY